ncbi:MAG: CoA transferase [Coprococcus sp.]
MAPHGCYPCAGDDSWCVIAVGNEEEWKRFQDELRNECPWVDDPMFETMEKRLDNYKVLDAKIAEWTPQYTNKEVVNRLQMAGVSAGMVQNAKDLLEDEHALETGFIKSIDFGESEIKPRYAKFTGRLLNIAGMPEIEYKLSAAVGRDNEYILKDILGMTDAEIQEAAADGAF